jgi:hypothetical protein
MASQDASYTPGSIEAKLAVLAGYLDSRNLSVFDPEEPQLLQVFRNVGLRGSKLRAFIARAIASGLLVEHSQGAVSFAHTVLRDHLSQLAAKQAPT